MHIRPRLYMQFLAWFPLKKLVWLNILLVLLVILMLLKPN